MSLPSALGSCLAIADYSPISRSWHKREPPRSPSFDQLRLRIANPKSIRRARNSFFFARRYNGRHCAEKETRTDRRMPDMAETQTIDRAELLSLTSEIVSSHVANNSVAIADLPDLIQSVYAKLADLSDGHVAAPEALVPAVPIKKSVTADYLVCLEDGKKLKTLKRHLMTSYNMTPEEYRARWGLKADYPMVSPNYAKKRQELAKKIGLGRKPKATRSRKG
jgi:predicted transcriptional regulator